MLEWHMRGRAEIKSYKAAGKAWDKGVKAFGVKWAALNVRRMQGKQIEEGEFGI